MERLVEILLVIVYNLTLLTGTSYLVVHYELSAWLYVVALCFGASWDDSRSLLVNMTKVKKENI